MNYDKFLNKLYNLQDLKYKRFQSKLISSDKLIGVRTPDLKRIAKIIAKENYLEFFRLNRHTIYEENLVHGLILGYLKLDYIKLKPLIDEFLPFIDNWAVCDLTVSNLKIYKKNETKDKCFNDIKKYIESSNPWINRFGYTLLLNYFIEDKYIDIVLKLCNKRSDFYYVKMAISWLISICYIKFKNKTINYLKNCNLDNWTYNKAIQKIIESNRVSSEDKIVLKGMKKK